MDRSKPEANKTRKKTGAEQIHWNLQDLFESEKQLHQSLEEVQSQAAQFAAQYRGKIAQLESGRLAAVLKEFEALQDRIDRAGTYGFLNWSADTGDSARGKLFQKVREVYSQVQQQLLFFELELIQLPEGQLKKWIQSDQLSPFRHYLETVQQRKGHVLSEAEEKILAEKSITGPAAWSRFFDETLGAARFPFRGESLTEQEVLAKLYEADRTVRKEAAESFTAGLRQLAHPLTFVFNTALAEKASDDRLRNFPHWLSSRNLSNEISDEAVDTLIESVVQRFDLVARFYHLKRALLGLDEMLEYDRYAPLEEVEKSFTWREAREIVEQSYFAFHPTLGEIVRRFFEEKWIDAALRPGKRGGAFSHAAVPQVHPYILMNFTGSIRDVQTLAHELGHGVHQYLSRKQGSLQARPPLTTSETASVFGEMLVFDRMMRGEQDEAVRLSMLVSKIDDITATVFRQIAMNRFEDRIHQARRSEGELASAQLSDLWMETQKLMFQDSIRLSEDYRIWWSYIPHFVHTPGYVYAYAFGELLVLALYNLYRQKPQGFADKYLALLEAGGSDWPHVLVGRLGIDLRDPQFWKQGLTAIEALIEDAEKLAESTGKIPGIPIVD